jgi:pimeloyl-ACP methyl ester carboxylesterase
MCTQPFVPSALRPTRKGWSLAAAVLPAVVLLPVAWCLAAAPAPENKPPAAPVADKGKSDDKQKPPPPEDVTLRTVDGVQLTATYFPSGKGKESVVIVPLHMWKRSRKDYRDLALELQSHGWAVLTPDLRGHGDSTTLSLGGKTETLDAAKFSPQQFTLMAKYDMLAVKDYLWERHNAGEFNLNQLCLVGAEMGAAVAVNFSLYDATGYGEGSAPGSPAYGTVQVGGFVKALVLLSPDWSFKGLPLKLPLANAAVCELSVMLFVGAETPKTLADSSRVYGILERYHPEPEGDNKLARKTLFRGRLHTSLQGTRLLDAKEFNVKNNIAEFIDLRLVHGPEANTNGWRWKELKKPHQG